MFHKTSTKLAGLYLAILMAISLFFSLSVYQLSTQEFDRGFRRQGAIIQRGPAFGLDATTRDELLQEQQGRFDEARLRVLRRLVLINLFILVGGGFLSYFLARRTLQPIEESHQALERFTADASHELRTPLAAMRVETEVTLMNPKLNVATAKKQLQSNLEEVQRLTTLSDGLLRLARLEKDSWQPIPLAVKQLLDEALQRVRPLAEQKSIRFEMQADELVVAGDANSLVEALVIILDNAIKYSHDDSAVRLKAHGVSGAAEISIVDEGIGMKTAELQRIFERFYRADSARTKEGTNGYGLGLAIAQDILAMHHGNISVRSAPDKGATFTLRLPLHE